MNGPRTLVRDEPNPKLVEYVLHAVGRDMLRQGYDAGSVTAYMKEHALRIGDMGGKELATRILHEMGPEDFGLTGHGPN